MTGTPLPFTTSATLFAGRPASIRTLQLPHASKGHDAFRSSDHAIVVVDGVTPKDGDDADSGEYALALANNLLPSDLHARMEHRPGVNPLLNFWSAAIADLVASMPVGSRSASAAQVYAGRGEVHAVAVGDVKVLIRTTDGGVFEVLNGRDQLRDHTGPLPTVGHDPHVVALATSISIDLMDVAGIALLTDGLWKLLPEEPRAAWEAMGSLVLDGPPDDDLTAVIVEFNALRR